MAHAITQPKAMSSGSWHGVRRHLGSLIFTTMVRILKQETIRGSSTFGLRRISLAINLTSVDPTGIAAR